MKAFSYLRVSGKGQVEGDGFTRQRDSINRYAKANRIEVSHEFLDEGVSGTKELENREGLASLLDKIESNGVRLVLVESADRVARDLLVGEVILSQFRDLGVTVVATSSASELTGDDSDPTKVLIRQILGAVAQFDKSVIVRKLKVARDRKRNSEGRCEGRKPYGEHEGEQEILDLIFKLRRKPKRGTRMSYQKIANRLNGDGLYSRSGLEWKAGTIRKIIIRAKPSLA